MYSSITKIILLRNFVDPAKMESTYLVVYKITFIPSRHNFQILFFHTSMLLLSSADIFSKFTFSKKKFKNTITELGTNCLQRLSADNKKLLLAREELEHFYMSTFNIVHVGVKQCPQILATYIMSLNAIKYDIGTLKRPLKNRQNKVLNDNW